MEENTLSERMLKACLVLGLGPLGLGFMGGCATAPDSVLTTESLAQKGEFALFFDATEEAVIDVSVGNVEGMRAIGYQYGAIGAGLMELAINEQARKLKAERVAALGTLWDDLNAVDTDALAMSVFSENTIAAFSNRPSLLDDISDRKAREAAGSSSRPSFVIDTSYAFSGALEFVTFRANYIGYWPASPGEAATSQIRGRVLKVYFVGESTLDFEENAERWKTSLNDPEIFVSDGYKSLLELIEYDLIADGMGTIQSRNRVEAWGFSGYLEKVTEGGEMYLRSGYDGNFLHVLPVPGVVDVELTKVAIRRVFEEKKDLSEMLKLELASQGIEASIVESFAAVNDVDALVVIEPKWGRDILKFLEAASIQILDPETEEVLSYGTFVGGKDRMIKVKAEEVLALAWEKASASALKAELKALQ